MRVEIYNDIFSSNLIWLRKKYALSQTALARLTGLAPIDIRGIERGRIATFADFQIFRRVCEIFQVSMEDLTGRYLDPDRDGGTPSEGCFWNKPNLGG